MEINENKIPNFKECCLENGWDYDTVIEKARNNPDLKKVISKLQNKREVLLEKGGILGDFNKPMVIFLLGNIERERALINEQQDFIRLDDILRTDLKNANMSVKPECADDLNDID